MRAEQRADRLRTAREPEQRPGVRDFSQPVPGDESGDGIRTTMNPAAMPPVVLGLTQRNR